MKVKKETTRSDTSKKSAPSKRKQKSQRALIYAAYIRSKQFKEVREIVRARQKRITVPATIRTTNGQDMVEKKRLIAAL